MFAASTKKALGTVTSNVVPKTKNKMQIFLFDVPSNDALKKMDPKSLSKTMAQKAAPTKKPVTAKVSNMNQTVSR